MRGLDRVTLIAGVGIPLATIAGAVVATTVAPDGPVTLVVLGLAALLTVVAVAFRGAASRGASAPPSDGWSALMIELERARRYERPLSVVRIGVRANPTGIAESLVDRVRSRIRKVDTAWLDEDSVYVLVPESGPASVADLVAHLIDGLGIDPIDIRSAAFPDDALTAGALIARLGSGAGEPVSIPLRAAREALGGATSDLDLPRVAGNERA